MRNFKKGFIYLFLESGEGREKERETNIDQLQPRNVLWLGIELVTFRFTEQRPSNWATMIRARNFIYLIFLFLCFIVYRIS